MNFEENYNKFINYSFKICNDEFLAIDLVHEAFIKIGNKKVNCSYVYLTIKSIYLDQKRKDKLTVDIENVDEFVEQNEFELKDEYNKVMEGMPFAIKECLLENQNYSLRKLEKRYHINYGKILRMVNKAKEIIKQNPKLKEYYGKD